MRKRPASTENAAPPAPRRRRWRRVMLLTSACVLLLAALPYAVGIAPVRTYIANTAAERLGAACRIDSLSFSWFRGFTAEGVEIGNPSGFTTDRPSLRIRRATVDKGRGFVLSAVVALHGLEVFVEQAADGTTNLQRLGAGPARDAKAPSPAPAPSAAAGSSLAFEASVRDGRIELRREGTLLDTMTEVAFDAKRAHGSSRMSVDVHGALAPGSLDLAVAIDGGEGPASGTLRAKQLDLARFAPLVATFAPGRLTSLAGVLEGDLRFQWRSGELLVLDGEIAVAAPRVAGPAVGGLDLRGERWTIKPALAIGSAASTATVVSAAAIDTRNFVMDLGWLLVRGSEPPAAPAGAMPQRTFVYQLDLAALASFGDLLPTWLRNSEARLTGDLHLPAEDLPPDAAGWLKAIAGQARLTMPRLSLAGFEVRDVDVGAQLQDGVCLLTSAESTRLDGGSLAATVSIDLSDRERLPTKGSVRWQGGRLHGGASAPLRYVMPFLAGLDPATATLTGACDLDLTFDGPGIAEPTQSRLEWLDAWSGNGAVAVRDAAFTPAPALRGLLTPLGSLLQGSAQISENGKLVIDAFSSPFSFSRGFVRTTATEWLAKGRKIGLSGTVRFDGVLDYAIDFTALLRGHRDGDRVLKALAGGLPPARLAGSIDAPTLGLPELGDVMTRVLEGELKQKGQDLLQRELDRLLRRR